ncbi:hypothetical protein PROFUN_14423 [Planoprotostelium fungivorum]|uniref:Uncharacterized protein n=1 Tax=Planoprotostelium fungivorum TaxID=1890364 RepID=A0A2P6MX88_9EUKA|nr:hypothetical protein PROFUN_14423 [Planoprotostelium fungivorum]
MSDSSHNNWKICTFDKYFMDIISSYAVGLLRQMKRGKIVYQHIGGLEVRTCRDIKIRVSVLSCNFRIRLDKKLLVSSRSRLANFFLGETEQDKTKSTLVSVLSRQFSPESHENNIQKLRCRANDISHHIPPDVATTNLNTKRKPIPNKSHDSMQVVAETRQWIYFSGVWIENTNCSHPLAMSKNKLFKLPLIY